MDDDISECEQIFFIQAMNIHVDHVDWGINAIQIL